MATFRKLSIAVACGGTGGHVFPGIATAQVLSSRGHAVTLWLAGKSVESSAVAEWAGPVVVIPSEGRLKLVLSILRCWWMLRRNKPDVVLAMGGFGSIGPCVAARLLGIRYVLHESNAVPGRATRLLSGGAVAVAVGFECVRDQIRCRKVVWTGTPVRREILDVVCRKEISVFCLLVLGGSGGAHAINEAVSAAVCSFAGCMFRVIHLTGKNDARMVSERYLKAGVCADVRAFENDIASLYVQADLVICRAGASTCAELVALNVPALLIPLPWAADDHQAANARAVESSGLVDVIPQADCSVKWLADYLRTKIGDGRILDRECFEDKLSAGSAAERLAALVEAHVHIP